MFGQCALNRRSIPGTQDTEPPAEFTEIWNCAETCQWLQSLGYDSSVAIVAQDVQHVSNHLLCVCSCVSSSIEHN